MNSKLDIGMQESEQNFIQKFSIGSTIIIVNLYTNNFWYFEVFVQTTN